MDIYCVYIYACIYVYTYIYIYIYIPMYTGYMESLLQGYCIEGLLTLSSVCSCELRSIFRVSRQDMVLRSHNIDKKNPVPTLHMALLARISTVAPTPCVVHVIAPWSQKGPP